MFLIRRDWPGRLATMTRPSSSTLAAAVLVLEGPDPADAWGRIIEAVAFRCPRPRLNAN